MAWRFKASKFKNATPIIPKPEMCVRDISVGSYQTYGNNIAASAAFMAFSVDHNGEMIQAVNCSSIAVLPIDDCGRKSKTMPLLHAHYDTVTDMDFSPFHDGLLATGSQDCMVKVWHIPESGLTESLSSPQCEFPHKQRRIECLQFHPTADCLLTTASYSSVTLWDIAVQKELLSCNEHGDVIQCVSWKRDGRLFATQCKDKMVRVVDPRANTVTHAANSHQSIKDSRVVWLGDTNRVLTTGFDLVRQREVYLRDIRSFKEPEKTFILDSSTGILIPLYDPDTCMLFLAGKGDTTISYLEVTEREPFLVEGIRHSGEQTKGACLVPKRSLNVMQGEVNRVLQLTSTSVIPIMYQVPRKSYRDFHTDLFPETTGCVTSLGPSQWLQGMDTQVPRISLDPNSKMQDKQMHRGTLENMKTQMDAKLSKQMQRVTLAMPVEKSVKKSVSVAKDNIFMKDSVESNGHCKGETDFKKMKDEESRKEKCENGAEIKYHNGNGEKETPPKPLPRASRTGSLSEISEDSVPKPVARPRTNSIVTNLATSLPQNTPPTVAYITTTSHISAYKPRLGPKPFTAPKLGAGEGDSCQLDRVFNVPQAPGSTGLILATADLPSDPTEMLLNGASPPSEEREDGERGEELLNGCASPGESKSGSDKEDCCGEGLMRGGSERSSIAERRRLYEARSVSVQEAASSNHSSVLRRRDSLKANKSVVAKEEEPSHGSPNKRNSFTRNEGTSTLTTAMPTPKRTSTVFGRVSKFRHLKGTPGHKSTHIENIRNVSRQISGECDGFHANSDRVAVPLSGPGGKIAVFELSKTGKLPDGVIPTLVHGTNIMDFSWDPFDNTRLAVACDDGTIKLWVIPVDGLTEPTNEPQSVLEGHAEKIYFIKFHPLASDVLASASYDMTVCVWDLTVPAIRIVLRGHTDQMFSLAWSPCGEVFATVCRDGLLRVYKPRVSEEPVAEGRGSSGSRGARLVWALNGTCLIVLGFDKVSERQIIAYRKEDLKTPLATVGLDVSPAILIPFYDEDSSTLFLTGKGDSTIYTFEVSAEAPFLCPLSHHRCPSLHQGLSFLPKKCCDVTQVEFAHALRLTNTSIEPLLFTVPRIKSDLFQDDLFPETKVTWVPTMSAADWFSGANCLQSRVSLKPSGMENLSEALGTSGASPPASSLSIMASEICQQPYNRLAWSSNDVAKQKQEQIQRSVSSRLEMNLKLEQDRMECVDEREWDE